MKQYRYQFRPLKQDFLDEEKSTRYLIARPVFRLVFVLIGLVWFVGGWVSFLTDASWWRSILGISLGAIVIYSFGLSPHIRRIQLKKSRFYNREVIIQFTPDNIALSVLGNGKIIKHWCELKKYQRVPKGILILFNKQLVYFLPNRVFADATERNNLLRFISDCKKMSKK